jgi:hypothetical protein
MAVKSKKFTIEVDLGPIEVVLHQEDLSDALTNPVNEAVKKALKGPLMQNKIKKAVEDSMIDLSASSRFKGLVNEAVIEKLKKGLMK